MQCSKSFSIEIEEDSSNLEWQESFSTIVPADWGTSSFTPINSTGNVAHIEITVPGDGGLVSEHERRNTATFTLNTLIATNGNVQVAIAGDTAEDKIWLLEIEDQAFSTILSETGFASGVFNFPFVIPSTGGIDNMITIRVSLKLEGHAAGQSATADFTFTGI